MGGAYDWCMSIPIEVIKLIDNIDATRRNQAIVRRSVQKINNPGLYQDDKGERTHSFQAAPMSAMVQTNFLTPS